MMTQNTAKRREQCRRNQARYRERQNQYALNLEEGVIKLQWQVSSLERERAIVSTMARGVSMRSSVWGVAVEYFRLFRHGVKAPGLIPKFGPESNVRLDFLRATMTKDVTDGHVYGAYALMEQWRLYSLFHGDLKMTLERVERGPHDSIVATTTTSMTITKDTILHAFPHLLKDHAGRSLVSRLLGCRFSMRGSVRFAWNVATGRVQRLTCSSDMVTPFLEILGSLEDVAFVFHQARVTLDDNMLKSTYPV